MGNINVKRETFESFIIDLENVKNALKEFDKNYVDEIIDDLNNMKSEFVTQYIKSMEIVNRELDKTITDDIENIISTTRNVIETFNFADEDIAKIVLKGKGSF